MTIRPGMMNAAPPIRAPARLRSRQAQKMASWVEAGPGHQVADGDGVLELAGVQPAPALDAQLAQQPDVRGRPAEPDAADPAPFPQNRRERHLRHVRGTVGRRRGRGAFPGLAHRGLAACGPRTTR